MYLEQTISSIAENLKELGNQLKYLNDKINTIATVIESAPVRVPRIQAAKEIGCCLATFDAHIRAGNVQVIQQGARVYVSNTEIARIKRDGLPKLRKSEHQSTDAITPKTKRTKRFAVPYLGKAQRSKRTNLSN